MEYFETLKSWQQALIATSFTYLMTALGAMLVLFFKKPREKLMCVMLALSAGVMMASSFFSLIMPALEQQSNALLLCLFFAIGGLSILLFDICLQRFYVDKKDKDRKKKDGVLLCFAVTVHNIPEGLAVGIAFGAALSQGALIQAIVLSFGIAVQNFPEGACVVFPLRAGGMSRKRSFFFGQASGVVEIFSGVLGALAVSGMRFILPYALVFAAGAMLAVVCSELVPDSFAIDKNISSVALVAGFIIMMYLDVAFS